MGLEFDLAGVGVRLEGDFADRLAFDFAAFPPASRVDLCVSGWVREPRPAPGVRERFRGPRGVCFEDGSVLYPGPVWVRGEVVEGMDPELVYERFYLTVLARVGLLLDRRGLHRVHGLGVGSSLILLPPGGGKSTLALELLPRGLPLVSEDTPLLDRRGRLHPFPFRLGVREPVLGSVARGGKWLLRADGYPLFAGRCRQVFVGGWTTGPPRVEPYWGRAALLRDCLVGYGVPQVAELFLQESVPSLARIALSRLAACLRLSVSARWYRLWLGPDPIANADLLEGWVRRALEP